ncbi:MAG: CdaR family protein [Candidatus Aminicenantales bacterium]
MRALRNFFFRNGWLKLLAFFMAFILWITLMPEEKIVSEKTFQVRLEPRNLPAAFEMTERPPASIDVTVRATNRLLGQMTSADVQAVLNLSRANVAQEDYPLNPDIVTVPEGAKAVRVFPNKVRLKIEKSAEVLMEIQPVLVGQPGAGFKVDHVDLLPSKVFVRGPESKIKPQDRIRTSPMDITGLKDLKVFEVDLILPRPELRFATAQTRATVTISLISK